MRFLLEKELLNFGHVPGPHFDWCLENGESHNDEIQSSIGTFSSCSMRTEDMNEGGPPNSRGVLMNKFQEMKYSKYY